MTIKPLRGEYLIKPDEEEEKIGRVVLAEQSKRRSDRGKVMVCGSGANVKCGDVVMFSRYSGKDVEIEGVMFVLLRAEGILGKEEV